MKDTKKTGQKPPGPYLKILVVRFIAAVPFRKWLRFPRGDLEPPHNALGVSRLSLLPRWSLRHLLQSTARNYKNETLMLYSKNSI
ncbi:hypothetical protein [Bacillus sp. LL01]|uniref:hypothetical protein n=1 Tax=Bacillus sp. LL01 TaxID=1665556 RepID=UPI000A3F81EE|nr:hypothetical protein [Bacillus sp. LL01]